VAAKKRMAAGGGDHGNQHTGGKVAGPVILPDPATTGDARDQAGKAVGVSGKSIDQTRHVRWNGVPERTLAVETGVAKVGYRVRLGRASALPASVGTLDGPYCCQILDVLQSTEG
jgi:hypothetical protein